MKHTNEKYIYDDETMNGRRILVYRIFWANCSATNFFKLCQDTEHPSNKAGVSFLWYYPLKDIACKDVGSTLMVLTPLRT